MAVVFPRSGPRRFGAKVDAFRMRIAVYWCLQCDRPAGEEKKRGQKTEMRCSNCGSKAHYFPSTGEHHRYAHLRMLQTVGEISELRLQPAFPIEINGIRVCTYRADFQYVDGRGKRVIEDYKGNRDHTDNSSALRRKLAEAMYGISVTIVEK